MVPRVKLVYLLSDVRDAELRLQNILTNSYVNSLQNNYCRSKTISSFLL